MEEEQGVSVKEAEDKRKELRSTYADLMKDM